MKIELLAAAAKVSDGTPVTGFPAGILRFALEYPAPADPGVARPAIEALIGHDGFSLRRSPMIDDLHLLLLEFPNVPREQSADYLFAVAQDLVEALSLRSCVPDVEPGWVNGDELGRDMPESIGGVVRRFCESHAVPPVDPLWSIRAVKAERAWRRFNATGRGILVGQPDTGIADHIELGEAVDAARGTDVLTGGGPPTDPLTQRGGNPGHGTATASCVSSRQIGLISGTAPGAVVVPLRCVDSVVIGSGNSVAAAIDFARNAGCHVVTMSLGGPLEFPVLRRAIARAVDSGMIVLAAAGNCVGLVVYPAWDPNVIAVAAVDEHDRRWRGSSHGAKIDVAAPGENVHVARRSTPQDLDKSLVLPGQGTSFAVAIAAGCAALWLGHHRVDVVRARAAELGTSVQALFRAAVRRTARTPQGWPGSLGAGIVDAEALLALPLGDIAAGAAVESGHPMRAELGSGFDWDRFGAEAGFLALDRAQRGNPERAAALESPASPRPSPALATALRQAGMEPRALFGAPSIRSPLTPEISPARALRIVAGGAGGSTSLESAGAVRVEAARSFIEGEGGKTLVEQLHRTLEGRPLPANAAADVVSLRDEILHSAPTAIKALAEGARPGQLTTPARAVIEALVRLTGRPALPIVDGKIDPQHPEIGNWFVDLWARRHDLRPLFDAVGRIDLEENGERIHYGTGTLVAPGMVMTNRHVLDAIAEPIPGPGGRSEFLLVGPVTISFDEDASDPARRFEITGVIAAGPDRIGQIADIGKLDMAFLSVKSVNDSGGALPPPPTMTPLAAGRKPMLAVVGYPAKPGQSSLIDPKTGQTSLAAWDRLWEIYQNRYGEKYVSPGEVNQGLGALAGDPRGWGFSHDATTLPGNSGSCVISLEDRRIFGLHFGGAPLQQNLAHAVSAVRDAAIAEGIIDPAPFQAMQWA